MEMAMSVKDDLAPNVPPPFVKLKEGATDTALAESWDGWVVEHTDNMKADYLKGVEYCDIALRKVLSTDNPGALTFSLITMIGKILKGEIEKGEMEKGFMDRLISLACDRRAQLDQN